MIDLASAVAPAVDAAAAEALISTLARDRAASAADSDERSPTPLSVSRVVASMRIALAVRRGARSEDIAYSSRIAHQQ